MKEDFSNNELEKRLKEEAGNFTLAPSEEVWKRISEELHPRRNRRPWLWALAALVGLSLASYLIWQHGGSSDALNHGGAPVSAGPAAAAKDDIIPPEEVEGTAAVPAVNPAEKSPATSKTVPEKGTSAAGRRSARRVFSGEIPKQQPASQPSAVPAGSANLQAADRGAPTYGLPPLQALSSLSWVRNAVAGDFVPSQVPLAPLNDISGQQTHPVTIAISETAGEKEPVKKKRRPSFELYVTPGRGYRILNVDNSKEKAQQMDNLLSGFAVVRHNKIDQKPDWGFSAGVRGVFPLGNKWSLETGLTVIRQGYRVKAFGTYPAYVSNNGNYAMASPAAPNRGNSFYASSSLAVDRAAQQKPAYIHNSYWYGQVPVLVNYRIGREDKVHVEVGLGGGLLYLIKTSPVIFAPESGRYFVNKDLLKPVNASVQMEVEAVIPMSRHLNLIFGPSMQYQLFSTYKDYPQVKEYPYFPGLKVGLRWLQ